MINVRKEVVNSLIRIENSGSYSNLELDSLIRKNEMSAEDVAFASRLFYGVIERKITIDYYIAKLSSKKLRNLSDLVLNCLRIGIYQLEFMNKIPESAAVNESVGIIKKSKEQYSAGFVNAVLRSFLRNKPVLPQDSSLFAISVRYSCPQWFVEELSGYIGTKNAIEFLADSLELPPTYIKVNNTLISSKELLKSFEQSGTPCNESGIKNCLILKNSAGIVNLPQFKAGYFHIEDLASQLLIAALSPNSDDNLLDICSAPGGKTCTASEYMNCCGSITACDLYEHRVKLIESNAKRLQLTNIKTQVNDALIHNNSFGKFSKIICDVPCSGFGVIRRKPEIKYKQFKELTNLADLQYNILNISSEYLKSGGSIVYSTCTLRKSENEDVVLRFLNSHKDFSLTKTEVLGNSDTMHRLLPNATKSDGFFFAVLTKGK